ncbi:N-acetylmuramoyl-L-alanine amidase [uncultured Dysosmobacter sp.]|uniref:N-acetylmuramoyl-L-alanine amidase n=1 Tax=uncultured Dysosmobacter sp. TaxID=2591384 RepID=UPI00262E98EC|nr:N-acetylmuramoyl-L-alanine amidase [uncultured Dysosmobacter sp.]
MILLLRMSKRSLAACFCCFLAVLAWVIFAGHHQTFLPVFAASESSPVFIIDPGHGGEDGGAVSPDGVAESHLNLAVARQVSDLLRLLGQQTVMTRTEDVTICDPDLATIRQRKASDLKNRVALVNGTENALLVSIHQNSLPSSTVTHGAQVFWNRQEGAEAMAERVQEALNSTVNAGNEKKARQIQPTIYLMKHVTAPGILVECGFLSNKEETLRLQDPAYQRRIAAAVAAGCRLSREELP